MVYMFVDCPNCGSKSIRHSKFQNFGERMMSWLGQHPLRCKDCQHRFFSRVWRFSDLRFSRCPRCYRMDLGKWSEEHYIPKFRTVFLLRIGAKRLRCEYCRFNFAGFRPVKERYVHRSQRKKTETHSEVVER